MDILIKGMEMPSEGRIINLTICSDGSVINNLPDAGGKMSSYRSERVKAVALLSHGRLVSAEDFIDSFEEIINECRRQLSEKGEDITVLNYFHDTIVELMGYMPTVLEATE